MEDTDFPEYGRQCELKEPWRGYRRGTIVGRNGYRYIIELSSGARIELYDESAMNTAVSILQTVGYTVHLRS